MFVATPDLLAKEFTSTLPFVAAEEALEDDLPSCDSEKAVDAAINKCVAAGGRPGCPAIDAAEKLKKDMAKAASSGKPMPKAKPRKNMGGATPGWANQGEGRKIAVTHDNSI